MAVKIGSAIVLDAEKMKIGHRFKLEGRIVCVDRIEDDQVFLRVGTVWDRIRYYQKQYIGFLIGGLLLFAAILIGWAAFLAETGR